MITCKITETSFCLSGSARYKKIYDYWIISIVNYITEAEKNGDNTKYLDYRGIFIDKDYGTILKDYIR